MARLGLGVFYAAMIVTGAVVASRLAGRPRQPARPGNPVLPGLLPSRRMLAPTTATIH
jgi:hypothetical protein